MFAAATIDLRTRRVPNVLTGTLAVIGLVLAAAGLGRVGLTGAALGCLVGVACMLPGHVFGATGAGDVKLLGAAGALLGPGPTVRAFVLTVIAGGVVALVVALKRGRLQATLASLRRLVTRADVDAGTRPAGDSHFAYAPAIAVGVIAVALGW